MAYISQHMCGNIEGDKKGEQENMENCEKEMDNKELMEKLEKMDKKLNALCDALTIFISTRGRKEAEVVKERLEKEGEFEGYEWEIKDQMAMANVCQGLREAIQEKSSKMDD